MKWLQFILSHSIFVAICAVALSFQTTQLLQLHINPFIYGFIFFATLCSYNFYWILSKLSFAQKAAVPALIKKEKTGFILLVISAAGLMYCFYRSNIDPGFVMT